MPKVHGKQILDATIEQRHLNLGPPDTGDTSAAATVGYVESLSGSTVVGPPETSYTEGLITGITESTRIGVVINMFNDVLKLLAPPSPAFWTGTTMSVNTPYQARILGSSAIVNITNNLTPRFIVVIPQKGLGDVTQGYLTFDVNGSVQEIYSFTGTTDKTTGVIRYTIGDPYSFMFWMTGFWTAFLTLSAESLTLTPSDLLQTANYTHSVDGVLSCSFYLDSPLVVSFDSIGGTYPTITRYISGVPSFSSGDTITDLSFNILNVASYFYSLLPVWELSSNLVNSISGDTDYVPTTYGETGVVTNQTLTILNGKFSDLSFHFTLRGRNSIGEYCTDVDFIDNTVRVDTVSDESSRLTSGSGIYPSTGWGDVYDSTQSLVGTYNEEMMLKNGVYQYPNGDYTTFGGDDYSTATGTRWVTFNMGYYEYLNFISLNIITSTGIIAFQQSNLYVEVKMSGSTYWLDATKYYLGYGVPGQFSDGDGCLTDGVESNTPTERKIIFGPAFYTGNLIVRIGITNNSITLKSVTITVIT